MKVRSQRHIIEQHNKLTRGKQHRTIRTNVSQHIYFTRLRFCSFRNCSFIFIKHIINLYIDIDDCYPDPCQNGGTCVDDVDSHACYCPAGFTGVHCEAGTCSLNIRCSFISSEGECIRTVLFVSTVVFFFYLLNL